MEPGYRFPWAETRDYSLVIALTTLVSFVTVWSSQRAKFNSIKMQLFSLSPRKTTNWNNNNNIRLENDLRQKLELLSWNYANVSPFQEQHVSASPTYRKPSTLFQNFALFVGQPTNQPMPTVREKFTVDVGVNTVNTTNDIGINTVSNSTCDVGVNTVNNTTVEGVNTINKSTTEVGVNTVNTTIDVGTSTMNKSTSEIGINTLTKCIDVAVNTEKKSACTTIGVNTEPTPQPLMPSWLKHPSLTTSPTLSLVTEFPLVPSVERLYFWSPESTLNSSLTRTNFELPCTPSSSVISSLSGTFSSMIYSLPSSQFSSIISSSSVLSAASSGSEESYSFSVNPGARSNVNRASGTQTTPGLQLVSRAQMMSVRAQVGASTQTSAKFAGELAQSNQGMQPYHITTTQVITRHAAIPIVEPAQVRFSRDLCGNFRVLGQGAYGAVYLARFIATGADLAIKFYSNTKDLVDHVLNEAMILSLLQNSSFVPKLYGIMGEPSNKDRPTIVQEFFGQGKTLFSIMDGRDENVHLTKEIKISIAFQLVFALKTIHETGVLINDIKSDNVLVDTSTPEYRIRYIDFGLATYKTSYTYSNIVGNVFAMMLAPGQYDYLAPEVRMGCPTTASSDVYSLGYLIGQLNCEDLKQISFMCCQEKPYHRPPIEKILEILDYLMSIT